MKEIVLGYTPKLGIISVSKGKEVAFLRIFDCINPDVKIGQRGIIESDYGNELCAIPFCSLEEIEDMYKFINVNKRINVNDEFLLIFTDNMKSVEAFKEWLIELKKYVVI